MANRRRKSKSGAPTWALVSGTLVIGVLAGLAIGAWLGNREEKAGSAPDPQPVSRALPVDNRPAATQPMEPRRREEAESVQYSELVGESAPAPMPVSMQSAIEPVVGARIALVIDDLGRGVQQIEALDALDVPISYSVLPFESRSPEVVAALVARQAEILCHLPMEPSDGSNPGPGALTGEMSSRQVRRATREALDRVPGAVGVNNHMGSGFTNRRRKMTAVLEVVAERELFYLDSRTSVDSLGFALARELGIATGERQVFIDAEVSTQGVRVQFARLLAIARERGSAIGIGHPSPTTLNVLRQEVPRAVAAGFEFVPVSYLLDRSGEPAP